MTGQVEPRRSEDILLVGEPSLRLCSDEVTQEELFSQEFGKEKERLKNALQQFREKFGFGRAIAAPQIGINKRMIALNLGSGTFLILNPVVSYRSEEKFTLWDDCMSSPWLMSRVQRSVRIQVEYMDEKGAKQTIDKEDIPPSYAELLQHEIDHLDGILNLDRAIEGARDMIAREVYCKRKAFFDRLVDYSIKPTIT